MSLFDKISNFSYNSYYNRASKVTASLSKISTGLRRPTARDGAALNSMAQEMEQKIRGSETIRTYLQTYDSFALTQDTYLQEVGDIIDEMTELASASLAGNDSQRTNLNLEYGKLTSSVKMILDTATFNGNRLFSKESSIVVRLGMQSTQQATFSEIKLTSVYDALAAANISTAADASAALLTLASQVNAVNYMRVLVGSHASIVSRAMSSTENMVSNLESAAETIMNVDLAKATAEYVKEQTLLDAANSALIQSNGLLTNIKSILNTLK